LAGCTPGAASTKSTDELLDYVTEKPRPKPLGRLEIAFLMASEVGRFLLQKRFFVAAAIPNDALIATNILGRLCRGLVRKAFCTPELGFEKNRSFLASRTPEKKRPAQGPATNLSGL